MTKEMVKGIETATYPLRDGEQIRIGKSEFKGKVRIDARIWYQDEQGEWKPTKKGLSLDDEALEFVVGTLLKIVKELDSEWAAK